MSNKAGKRGLVPKLRFPEFQEAGEWSKEKLGAVATLYKGKGISKADIVANGVQPCIRYGELYTVYEETIHETASSTNVDARELFLSKKNDVIIPASGETKIDIAKASCVMSDDIALGGDLNVIRSSQNGIFLSYQLNGPLRLSIAKVAQGNTVVHLYPTQIEQLDVLVPSLIEQQNIADCLASLDELLTLEAQKLDTLKTHKKGLTQQLFPVEGETLPKLRFPEFQDAGEWEEKKAGALFGNRLEDGKDGLPIYSVTMNDGMVKRSSLERRVDDIAESGGNKKARKGDIAYNMMRMWQGAFGVAPEDCMVSPAYVVLSPEGNACSDLFGYLFKLPKYLQLLTSHSQGLTLDRLRLYYKDFARIPVLIPSPLEQQKIADCLASLDNFIIAQTQKLAALKTHKKGLMQQLFPAVDEAAA